MPRYQPVNRVSATAAPKAPPAGLVLLRDEGSVKVAPVPVNVAVELRTVAVHPGDAQVETDQFSDVVLRLRRLDDFRADTPSRPVARPSPPGKASPPLHFSLKDGVPMS